MRDDQNTWNWPLIVAALVPLAAMGIFVLSQAVSSAA